jgi:hypothetical protein
VNFEEDIRRHVLGHLPHDPGQAAALAAKDAADLLIIYFNWVNRAVPAKPRMVHCSTALSANPLTGDPRYKPALDKIVAALKAGDDIKPHLSKDILCGYGLGAGWRRDLDLMLNDWGIHHLHLSTVIEADGFAKRTGPLLFAVFRPADAYLIDIMEHGAWTREHAIQVIVREWPGKELVGEMYGLGLEAPLSAQERETLRNKHINAYVEVDGKLYMPSSGLSTSGVATQHVIAADRIMYEISAFRAMIQRKPEYINRAFVDNGVVPPPTLDLHFEFLEDGGYGIVERQTSVLFRLT